MTYTPLPRPQQQQPQQDVHSRRHSAPAANAVDDSDESDDDSRSEAGSSEDEGPFGGPSSRKMRMTTEALVHVNREDNMDEGITQRFAEPQKLDSRELVNTYKKCCQSGSGTGSYK
jgi:hypothetical protein